MALRQTQTSNPTSFVPFGYLPEPDKTKPKTCQAKRGKHTDLYQSVTDTVIAQLEAGTVPWVQPWGRPDIETPFGLPTNGQTGRTIEA